MREFSTFNGPPLATGYSTITSSLINRPNQLSSTNTHDPYLIKVLHSTQLSRPNVISFIGSLERYFASSDQSLNLSSIKKLLNHYIRLKEMRPRKAEQSAIALFKNALSKPNGYFSRFLSNETWFEWAEQRTALGKLISAYEAQSAGDRYATQALDFTGIQQAISETGGLLKQLKTLLKKQNSEELSKDPQDNVSGYAAAILPTSLSQTISSSCVNGLVAGTVASLAVQHPMPFFVGLSGCLPGVTAVDSVDLTRGLMGYYPFNGNANDESGQSPPHHGTVQGAMLTKDRFGNENSAYFFDGQNDYINLGGERFFNFPEITIAAWTRPRWPPSKSQISMQICGKMTNDGNGFQLKIVYGKVYVHIGRKGGTYTTFIYPIDASVIQESNWIFLAVTHSENHGSKIYLNGDMKFEDSENFQIAPSSPPASIGALKWRSHYTDFFHGAIDDVRIYNRALSAEEIRALDTLSDFTQGLVAYFPFNGNANDESKSHNDCIVHGATLTEDMYRNPQSTYSFDGSSQYISCQTHQLPNGTASRSLAAWVKLKNVQNDPVIVEYGTNQALQNCGIRVVNQKWQFSFWSTNLQTQTSPPLSKWTHVVMTYDGKSHVATAYQNAQKIAENVFLLNTQISSEGLTIGRIPEPSNNNYFYLGATIDEIRVYDRSLSQKEIDKLYNSRFKPFFATNLTQQITYQEDAPKVDIQAIKITTPGPYANVMMRLPSVKVGKLGLSAKHVSSVNYLKEKKGIQLMGSVSAINTLLQTVFYTPSANYNHDFIITFKISNGVNSPLTGTINMQGQAVNDAPFIIGGGIPNQEITMNKLFSLNVTQYFSDVDIATNNDVLTFTAKLGNGKVLPDWLGINEITGILSGIPIEPSSQNIRITAADKASKKVIDDFDLAVYAATHNRQLALIIGGSAAFSLLALFLGILIGRKIKSHSQSEDYQRMRNDHRDADANRENIELQDRPFPDGVRLNELT